jgi:hypothetical protein
MKAARIHNFGGPEVIVLEDVHARCHQLETYWCESLLQELGRGMR